MDQDDSANMCLTIAEKAKRNNLKYNKKTQLLRGVPKNDYFEYFEKFTGTQQC